MLPHRRCHSTETVAVTVALALLRSRSRSDTLSIFFKASFRTEQRTWRRVCRQDDVCDAGGGSQEGGDPSALGLGVEAGELRSKVASLAKLARGASGGEDTGKSGSSEIPAGAPSAAAENGARTLLLREYQYSSCFARPSYRPHTSGGCVETS